MYNYQIDYQHLNDSWLSLIGILVLTMMTLTNEFKSVMIMYMITMLSAFVLKYYNYGTIPNLFYCFLIVTLINYVVNIFNYTVMMNEEIQKLSKVLEVYGRENLLFDIVNTKEKVNAEFLINYYKIQISGDKEKIINTINNIIIPENIKMCQIEEIKDRINKFILYVKTEKFFVQNSVYIWGFVPSNSMIEFYIKLINQKKYICQKNKNYSDLKVRAWSVLKGIKNNFDAVDMLEYSLIDSTVPDYKINNEEYFYLLNKTIGGIERYFDIYKHNNYYFI